MRCGWAGLAGDFIGMVFFPVFVEVDGFLFLDFLFGLEVAFRIVDVVLFHMVRTGYRLRPPEGLLARRSEEAGMQRFCR